MSIDGQDDDYTAWLRRIEIILQRDYAVHQDVVTNFTLKADTDGVLNYSNQRKGVVSFEDLARMTYLHWIKG